MVLRNRITNIQCHKLLTQWDSPENYNWSQEHQQDSIPLFFLKQFIHKDNKLKLFLDKTEVILINKISAIKAVAYCWKDPSFFHRHCTKHGSSVRPNSITEESVSVGKNTHVLPIAFGSWTSLPCLETADLATLTHTITTLKLEYYNWGRTWTGSQITSCWTGLVCGSWKAVSANLEWITHKPNELPTNP